MKKYVVLSTLCLLIAGASFGQTRKIMHRSHSGKDHSLFRDDAADNFGISPEMKKFRDSIVWNSNRDSIKVLKRKDSLQAAPPKAGKKQVKASAAKKKK